MTLERLWSAVRTILTIIAFIGLLCVARYLLMSTAPMWTDESFALVTSPVTSAFSLFQQLKRGLKDFSSEASRSEWPTRTSSTARSRTTQTTTLMKNFQASFP